MYSSSRRRDATSAAASKTGRTGSQIVDEAFEIVQTVVVLTGACEPTTSISAFDTRRRRPPESPRAGRVMGENEQDDIADHLAAACWKCRRTCRNKEQLRPPLPPLGAPSYHHGLVVLVRR